MIIDQERTMTQQELNNLKTDLNIYGQSESLLFQFILAEFLIAYKEIQKIEKIYSEIELKLIKNHLHASVNHALYSILEILPQMVGDPIIANHEYPFQWTYNTGSLSKLKHFAYLFSQRRPDYSEAVNMNVYVSKAFHSALQLREVILSIQHKLSDYQIPNYITFYQLTDKLIDNIRLTSRLMIKVLVHKKEDENILRFLLDNQEDFDAVYRKSFVQRILKMMYPKGMKHAKDLIVEKYVRRGFLGLLEPISEQFAKLESLGVSK